MRDFLRRHYLPDNFPKGATLGLAATGIFIALVTLTLEFYGWQQPFLRMAGPVFGLGDLSRNELNFYAQVYTSASFFVLLVLLPGLMHLFSPLRGNNPYGLSARHFCANMRLYLPLLAVMLPVLWVACSNPAFSDFYPLYKPATLRDLAIYEAIYLTQFVAVEFFYRGFCLFRFERLAPGFGIFIMVIPYALLHIHKPFPEALGSVVAGLVLGALALKSRSIWPVCSRTARWRCRQTCSHCYTPEGWRSCCHSPGNMLEHTSLAPTQNLQRIWLLHLVLPFGGAFNRLLTGLLIIVVTWITLWLFSDDISRYELAFFACLFGYSVVIFSRIIEQSERAVDEIQSATAMPAEDLAPLRNYMSRYTRGELAYNLIGALLAGSIHVAVIRASHDTPLEEIFRNRELYASQVGTLAAWVILTFVISSLINNAMAWSRLGRVIRIDLLRPRAVCAIGRIAVLSTLSVIGAQVLFVILIIDSGWDWFTTFPGLLASSLPTLAMFLIPVWPLHRRLHESKARALAGLDRKIGALGNVADFELDDSHRIDELNRLLQLRREVREASVWPFDASNLLRLVFYLLLVPMTWVGAALVESVVDALVD